MEDFAKSDADVNFLGSKCSNHFVGLSAAFSNSRSCASFNIQNSGIHKHACTLFPSLVMAVNIPTVDGTIYMWTCSGNISSNIA